MKSRASTRLIGNHATALLVGGLLALIWATALVMSWRAAALPQEADGIVLAVFSPMEANEGRFAAILRAGGRPLRQTWVPFAWVAHSEEMGFAGRLRAEGAIAVLGEMPLVPTLAGCFAYVPENLPKPYVNP